MQVNPKRFPIGVLTTSTNAMLARKFFKKALRKRVAPERILVIASRSNGFLKVRSQMHGRRSSLLC